MFVCCSSNMLSLRPAARRHDNLHVPCAQERRKRSTESNMHIALYACMYAVAGLVLISADSTGYKVLCIPAGVCKHHQSLDVGKAEGGQQYMLAREHARMASVNIQRLATLDHLQRKIHMPLLRLSLGRMVCACVQGTSAEQGGRCPGAA